MYYFNLIFIFIQFIFLQSEFMEKKNKFEENTESKKVERKNSFKKFELNTSNSRGELKLLRILIEKNDWREIFTGIGGNVMWCSLEFTSSDSYFAELIKINRIPGLRDICSKSGTGYILNKLFEYFPSEFTFFPKTFLFPNESEKFMKYFQKNKNKIFITKPSSGSQGEGIYLIKSMNNLPYGLEFKDNIVQEYITKPLIIDEKKFDLRLYVLISSLEPLIVYLNDEGFYF